MNNNVFVIIPTFNEENNIKTTIEEVKKYNHDVNIIVVNDGSTDNTNNVVKKMDVILLNHLINLGQWAALRTGFYYALRNDANIVVTLDGDGQHFGYDLGKMIDPILLKECDIVIGSRFKQEKPDMFFHRFIGIHLFNFLFKIKTGTTISDCTSGFRAYNANILRKILRDINENQYGALESLIISLDHKARIKELSINSNRTLKSNKGSIKFGYHLLRTILKN